MVPGRRLEGDGTVAAGEESLYLKAGPYRISTSGRMSIYALESTCLSLGQPLGEALSADMKKPALAINVDPDLLTVLTTMQSHSCRVDK